MAKIDQTPKEVAVMVYVDGILHDSYINKAVPSYAVDYISQAAVVQVADPDLDAAMDELDSHMSA